MKQHDDQLLILRIAKYYYLDGLSQQEISEKENIHRSQISRILKQARDQGYVKIRVSIPESGTSDALGNQLRELLGLKAVYVAPTMSAKADQSEALSFFAARQLEEILPECQNIGVGLGKTLYHVAAQLTSQRVNKPLKFFSVVGSSGTNNPYLQPSVILDNFAKHFRGSCHYNNFTICQKRSMMSPFDLKRFDELQKAYQKLDTVVLSIAGPMNINYPYFDEFSLFSKKIDISQALTKPHANLLGHVMYENHHSLQLPEDYFMTSMPLSLLEKTENVICIAHGSEKVNPIISAARQHYIKVLITDETTAQALIQKLTQVS
nr:sugar-binding domain-containing protein [uncultured Acetobacterium sp.]